MMPLLKDIKKSPHENLLGGWLLLLFGLFVLGAAALDSAPKLRAYRWVAGTALVTKTDMYQRTGRSHAWCGRVSYTYVVDGRVYKSRSMSSSIISDVGCNLDQAKVSARLAALPAGAGVRIFYDPDLPERVALVREWLKWHDFLFQLMAMALLGVGIYCIVQARRLLRQ